MECFRCGFNYEIEKYCPNCLSYSKFNNNMIERYIKRHNKNSKLVLNYNLTLLQQQTSLKIQNIKKDILIHAVCGAGKTEIVINEIYNYLKIGKRIGFFIPRIEIAKEIFYKLKIFFPLNSISLVYKNKKAILSDIVIATCHQAWKYLNQIDLVILDEVDAFPLSKSTILQNICFNLARDKTIFLSATPPNYLPSDIKVIELNNRFHNHSIPVPKVKISKMMQKDLKIILQKNKKQLFVFFPTIKLQEKYFKYFKNKFKMAKINSKTKNNKDVLYKFRKKELSIIFTTSVLERGVTFQNLNIIIVNSDHDLYTKNELIQISGRVGRSPKYPKGYALFLGFNKTIQMKNAIKEIEIKNEMSNLQHINN